MATDLLSHGREPTPGEEPTPSWTLRFTRVARGLGVAAAMSAVVGVSTVRSHQPTAANPARVAARAERPAAARLGAFVRPSFDPTLRAASAEVMLDGSFIVAPFARPSAPAARRAAELVMAKQCSRIERPRFRLIRGSPRGLSATFVVARAVETPVRNAGFQLRLTWDEGRYVGVISDAYGGCGGP